MTTYEHARQYAPDVFRHADGRRYRYSDRADSTRKAYGRKIFSDGTESAYMELPSDLTPEPRRITETLAFAHHIKSLGFRVFVAKSQTYGFITDADGTRVLSFEWDCWKLSGNYGPPSRASGTGWSMGEFLWNKLQTADDVKRYLYATAPDWCGKGWKSYTTLAMHLGMYGSSSGFTEYGA